MRDSWGSQLELQMIPFTSSTLPELPKYKCKLPSPSTPILYAIYIYIRIYIYTRHVCHIIYSIRMFQPVAQWNRFAPKTPKTRTSDSDRLTVAGVSPSSIFLDRRNLLPRGIADFLSSFCRCCASQTLGGVVVCTSSGCLAATWNP